MGGDDLGEERLGRGDGDLRPGVGVDDRVRLARDRRAVGVADREHLRALLPGVAECHQGVHGLAALADRDHQGVAVEDRVAVAELRRQLDLAGDPRPVLDRVLREQAGVERRTAGDDDDLVDLAQLAVRQPHLVELEPAVPAEPPEQGVGDRLGLLGDLLEHEVVVARLLRRFDVPVDVEPPAVHGAADEVRDADGVPRDGDHLVLAELHRVAGVVDEGGDVGREEVLPVAEPDHQR